MAEPVEPYVYVLIRLVPRVDRGECLNLGIVLFCRSRRYLAGRYSIDPERWRALAPALPAEAIRRQVMIHEAVIAGDPGGGVIAALPAAERFGWLSAPASTVVQPGPVHAGLTADPAATLEHLFRWLVVPLPAPEGELGTRS